jgi:hypothetical protein
MKLREGDIVQCECDDCFVELRVRTSCTGETCGTECDTELRCCGREMRVKGHK